ncbi:uncharacterized protein LOC124419264 [Lucilia cuprina]|uniref:uncharacterized protein LOC124419264 n=1 Tax=Lucilia cuprina TaxID=7375 RepID=UPI001F0630B0|nr:uncharacterized protein LOC124419264 [Lucilia cuprina]
MEENPDGSMARLGQGGIEPPPKLTRLSDGNETTFKLPLTARNNDFEKFAGENMAAGITSDHENSTSMDTTEDRNDPTIHVSMEMPVLYEDDHKGPFVVYVDTIKSEPRTPINQFRLTKKLIDLNVGEIDYIIKIGYCRCKIVFKTRRAANVFVMDKRLENSGYVAQIFTHLLTKTGIIFNIPEEISMYELFGLLNSPVPIVKLIRMTKKNGNEREPTMKVKVVFKGLQIPREMDFAYTKLVTKPFIPFGQCYNCYRFNHIADNCKQKDKTCNNCFKRHNVGDNCDPSNIQCSNCGDNHAPTNRSCPAREKALNLKRIMVLENLSIKDARIKYAGLVGGNRFELLGEEGMENVFPRINNKKDRIVNNMTEAAKFLHKSNSFAKVLKNNGNRQREQANARRDMETWREMTREQELEYNNGNDITNPYSVS